MEVGLRAVVIECGLDGHSKGSGLRVGSSLADHLFSQFSAETRGLFSKYEGGADADLAEALVSCEYKRGLDKQDITRYGDDMLEIKDRRWGAGRGEKQRRADPAADNVRRP